MEDGARISVDAAKVNALLRELNLSEAEPRKAIRSALRDAGNVIKRAVRGGLTSISQDPSKARGVQVKVYKNASGCRVQIYNAFVPAKGRIFILRWFEEGTQARYTRKGGAFRGSTSARPFFEQAAGSARSEAERELESFITGRIQKIADKNK